MLLKLKPEARKAYFKILTLDEFKKAVRKSKINNVVFIKATHKSYDRLTKQELTAYVEEHWEDAEDKIVPIYIAATNNAISQKFRKYNELRRIIGDRSHDELSDSEINQIESFRQEYEKAGFQLQYDDLLTLNYKLNKEEEQKREGERQQQYIDRLKDDLNKAQDKLKIITDDNETLKKEIKQKDKELKDLKEKSDAQAKQIERLNNRFAVKNVSSSVAKVLNVTDLSAESYDDLYKQITSTEESAFNDEKYDDLLKILAAKFAVAKIMRGEEQ